MQANIELEFVRVVPYEEFDEEGNSTGVEGDDWGNVFLDSQYETILAYSIGPRQSTENNVVITNGLVVGLPDHYGIKANDMIGVWLNSPIDGEYHVDGDIIDCNLGPWNYRPGYVMHLKRGRGNTEALPLIDD